MSGIFKKFVFICTLFGCASGLWACNEDEYTNEANIPSIYERVTTLFDTAKCTTQNGKVVCNIKSCRNLKDIIEHLQMPGNTCDEYNQSLNNHSNNPNYLATMPDNAGFYLTAYLLAFGMQKDFFDNCTGTDTERADLKQKFTGYFHGCEKFLEDAKKVSQARPQLL